ncbi:MAG: hypothetical protein Q9220_005676 [cf. Caloplaca sp. 1 TL-2023]
MPTDDYTFAAGGGLRLKGVSSSAKISKHKKKRPPKQPETEQRKLPSTNPDTETTKSLEQAQWSDEPERSRDEKLDPEDTTNTQTPATPPQPRGKTEAELRHEERRRRRLEERLRREGTKTHKERVEEFNHYLSNLSEHHDMPRIGPG